MEEYITRNNAISAVCFGCNQEFSDEPCEPDACAIRQSIEALPTADVVPKSEVEALKDDNKFLQDRRFKELSEVRQEVVREIFEEIEKYVIRGISVGGEHLTLFNSKNYAELKKKYTGE